MGVTFQYRTKSGAVFEVTPTLVSEIDRLTAEVTATLEERGRAGCYLGYLSVPISSRGGGHFATNIAMAASIATRVTARFGAKLYVLNPAAYSLPRGATGSDYMAVWSDVLAGADGQGRTFDLVYFVGPDDVLNFFGASGDDRLGTLERWLSTKATTDPEYDAIVKDAAKCRAFLRYYGIRGSAAFSKGAHDEWNIAMRLNALREVGDSIAIYFDGSPIEPGDYDDATSRGTEVPVLHGA